MNDMTPGKLHNGPPDPLDDALAPYGDFISEAETWLDGTPVSDEGQMKAVDALLKEIKAADKAVKGAEKSETAPLYDQWKAAKDRFKPTIEDLERIKKGLTSLVGDFKRKLAAEKAEAERKARMEAAELRRKAEEAARKVEASDIEAKREADAAMEAAKRAAKDVQAASKDTVKGLRKVTRYEIESHRDLLHWIAKNDRDAITAFVDEYALRNHKATSSVDGLRVWEEKEAF